MTSYEDSPGAAAGRFALVNELRAELIQATTFGDFERAVNLAGAAFRLIENNLADLDIDAIEATPHRAQAAAVFTDLTANGVTEVEYSTIQAVLATNDGPLRDLLHRYGVDGITAIGPLTIAPRRCEHDRPSYDGNCLSTPPCPTIS